MHLLDLLLLQVGDEGVVALLRLAELLGDVAHVDGLALLDRVPPEVCSRVAAVAVDGTSGTVLMVDGATGEPIYPPMLYNEKRPDAMPAVEAMAPEGHTVRSATSALCVSH